MTDDELDEAEARSDVPALVGEVRRLWSENDQLRRDRYEALTVHTKEGLLASEWLARTGRAEATVKRAHALIARWRTYPGEMGLLETCADELEAALRGGK